MKVLGVSYGYHDASAALVVDGRVVAASAEERFTRQKHDANFPDHAIRFCLGRAGLRPEDLDQVVFHEDPHAKFARVLASSLAPFPSSRSEFVNATKAWLGRKLWAVNTLSSRLGVAPDGVTYLSHHFSHAVQAFLGSGFSESAVLVVDAVGDWACTALYSGRWEGGVPKVERLLELAFPNSLGLVYSAVTAHLGFSPNDSECSTMALASFGTPRFGELERIVAPAADGTYDVDQSYFNFSRYYRGPVTPKFTDVFGASRTPRAALPLRSFGEAPEPGADARRWADTAASLQSVLEERLIALAERLHRECPSENLCYAGGVSLNCVANTRLLERGPFRRIYIPPDPGDGGTSVGTALYYAAVHGDATPEAARYDPYVGADFDAARDVPLVDHFDPDHALPYLKRGVTPKPGVRWDHRRFDSIDALVVDVVERLLAGHIVGWCQGRAELGPRALGNRSILMRPDDCELALRLSQTVKDRALYRPYAFSVTEEDAPRVLAVAPETVGVHRWMQFAVPVKEELRPKVRAALHVDGTTRPQVCARAHNPRFHALLAAFGERFGLAALLNTSFNASGYPLVTTPVEAMVLFARTGMDALVLDDTVIWKR